jgi:hypothetical protein
VSQQDIRATRRTSAQAPAQTPYDTKEGEYDDVWPTRLPTSSRRYIPVPIQRAATRQGSRKRVVNVYDLPLNIPPRRSRITTEDYAPPALPPGQAQRRSHVHWLLFVGVGMIAMLALWVLGNLAVDWWNVTQDDWHYGRPRTFQIDARVGHNDDVTPSHFIAVNLNRHIIIIEFPGGDPTKAKDYLGPTLFGDGQDLTPVTLNFKDVNGDGKLDMIVHIQDQTFVFLNDGAQFRPQKPGEHITL